MSMCPDGAVEIPMETVRVARAAFPKGSLPIQVRDELGVLFRDEDFADLFPAWGKPAWPPGRLALVLVLQSRHPSPVLHGRLPTLPCQGFVHARTTPQADFPGPGQPGSSAPAPGRAGVEARYQLRVGVEDTISQGVGRCRLRRSRYRGLAKTSLQHQLTGAAINLARIDAWLSGTSHARTRVSHFAAFQQSETEQRLRS
ncbi:transposase [Streptomyces sp. NPDC058676]|uniref:transposase n=1 Tax=unclassified Streptomyces TaxID=2593676 RepID=UPI003646A0A4